VVARARAVPWRSLWPIGVVAALILVAVGYVGVQYLMDQHNYQQGNAAYLQADCALAIGFYDKVIDGWQLTNVGGFTELARKERGECVPFQAAVDKQTRGDMSGALVAYGDFVETAGESLLGSAARQRITGLFNQAPPAQLASDALCRKTDTLLENGLIAEREKHLPGLYVACGQVYDADGQHERSFAAYQRLLIEYPDHNLSKEAEAALRTHPLLCAEVNALQDQPTIAQRVDFMSSVYFECGQAYEAQGAEADAFQMYKTFLIQHADHPQAPAAEEALLRNHVACERYRSLKNTQIAERVDFLPRLYYSCGQAYATEENYAQAIDLYEQFRTEYPDHNLSSDVEAALAQAIVAEAGTSGAGEIPEPEQSGYTSAGNTVVVIQNDSPERLRITFSGPEAHVEEMEACDTCENFMFFEPSSCSGKGPIERYAMGPGQYDVVVEAISDRGVTPFKGTWNLSGGYEYDHCFFIVTTFGG